jgi:hypothetical protein
MEAAFSLPSLILITFCKLVGTPEEVSCMKFYLLVSINCSDTAL